MKKGLCLLITLTYVFINALICPAYTETELQKSNDTMILAQKESLVKKIDKNFNAIYMNEFVWSSMDIDKKELSAFFFYTYLNQRKKARWVLER